MMEVTLILKDREQPVLAYIDQVQLYLCRWLAGKNHLDMSGAICRRFSKCIHFKLIGF